MRPAPGRPGARPADLDREPGRAAGGRRRQSVSRSASVSSIEGTEYVTCANATRPSGLTVPVVNGSVTKATLGAARRVGQHVAHLGRVRGIGQRAALRRGEDDPRGGTRGVGRREPRLERVDGLLRLGAGDGEARGASGP